MPEALIVQQWHQYVRYAFHRVFIERSSVNIATKSFNVSSSSGRSAKDRSRKFFEVSTDVRSKPKTIAAMESLGRVRLSDSFFMREFLVSEIASVHGLLNAPDNPELAIETGSMLCSTLLEPLQKKFGRIAIRSAYRSAEVNALGNRIGASCSTNETDAAGHIWDMLNEKGEKGAMATVIVPSFWDKHHGEGDWQKIAWWIHDHLPYSKLQFYPKFFAFNISWHESPKRRITSYVAPRGILTKPGMDNHDGWHGSQWSDL